ncbi:MAG TPA: hypothetical protein VHX44_04175 [Planctomycetota bacterium]|nr:hypothetical protein [Planctomycetota bacterium]
MASKHPRFEQVWGPSEQPDRLRINKAPLRSASLAEYFASVMTLTATAPLLAARWAFLPPRRIAPPAAADFLGVALSPDAQFGDQLPGLIAELGVRRLLLRVPVWERHHFADFRRFADRFPKCDIVIAVLQDRSSVCEPRQWTEDLRALITAFTGRATHFQLPMASNRTKWGCVHMGDALDLMEAAHHLRAEFPWLRLIGPGVIDFEPIPWLRGLVNLRRYQLDVVGALLYVDRRGSPRNTQYGIFDLAGKIRLWRAIADVSNHCPQRSATPLWLTEFNWPLTGTKPWSPTGSPEMVSEDEAATYLKEYCQIAWATGMVERVYWWQLAHPGFGLVDTRDGVLRRRPAFEVARRLLSGEIPLDATRKRQ